MLKDIKVELSTWKILSEIKLSKSFKSMDSLILELLKHYKKCKEV